MATLLDLQATLNSQGNILPGYEQLIELNFNSIEDFVNQHAIDIENLQTTSLNVENQLNQYFEEREENVLEFEDIIEGSIELSGYTITVPEGTYLKEEHIPLIELSKILDSDQFVKMRSEERDFLLTLMSQSADGENLQIQINNNAFINERVQFTSGRSLKISQIAGETENDPIKINFDSTIPLEFYRSSRSNVIPWRPDLGNPYRFKVFNGPYENGTLRVYINGHRIPANLIDQSFASIGEFRFVSTLPLSELPNINSNDFLSADFDIPLFFGPDTEDEELGNWWGDIITQSDGSTLDADSPLKPLRFYPVSGDLGSSNVLQIRSTNPFGSTDTGIDTIYIILDIGQIDHNLLKNYEPDRHHLPGSDNQNVFTKFIDPGLKSITAFSQETTIRLDSEDDSIDINIDGNKIDFAIKTLNVVDIDGGTIDGTPIGLDDPDEGRFTSIRVIGPNTPVYLEKNDDTDNTAVVMNISDPDYLGEILEVQKQNKWVLRTLAEGRTDFRINPEIIPILPTILDDTVATFSNDAENGNSFISIINNDENFSGILFGDNISESKIGIIADTGDTEQLDIFANSDPQNYLRLDVTQNRWIAGRDFQVLGTLFAKIGANDLDFLTIDPLNRNYNTVPGSLINLINPVPYMNLVSDEDQPSGIFFGDASDPSLGTVVYEPQAHNFIVIVNDNDVVLQIGDIGVFGGSRFDVAPNFNTNFDVPAGSSFNVQNTTALMSLLSNDGVGSGIFFGTESDIDSNGIFYNPISQEINILINSDFAYQFRDSEFVLGARILAAEGSELQPSISFDDGTSTGFYVSDQPGGGIALSVDGTRRINIGPGYTHADLKTIIDDGNKNYTPAAAYSLAVLGDFGLISCVCNAGNSTGVHLGDQNNPLQGGIFYDTTAQVLALASNGINKMFLRNTYAEFIDELQADTYIVPEIASDPSVGVSNETKIYMRDDKLIIIYDDAGTTKYRYLDLTSTNATWIYSTVAP